MICKECGSYYVQKHPNQKRCPDCIAARPHKGKHAAGKLGDKYVAEARERLWGNMKHWNSKMSVDQLYRTFPDLKPRNVKS